MSRLRSMLPVLLAGTVAGGVLTGLALGADPAGAQDDTRQPVSVSAMQRDHMLTEMRGMLAAVNGVLRGVASRDTALVRSSAAKAGMTAMMAQMRARRDSMMAGGMPMGPRAPMTDSAMRARHDSMMAAGMPMGPAAPMADSAMRARHDSMMAAGMAPGAMRDSMMGRGTGMGMGMGMGPMPQAFHQLMMGTHMAFDSLATVAANRRTPRDTIVARVSRITNNCVSCHQMYRLDVR